MKPITFCCRETFRASAEEIAQQMLDLDQWANFAGYGPLPGIQKAEFIERTEGIAGTRIRVKNSDGSQHVEEIVEWNPAQRLKLQMSQFSKPLCHLATGFDEVWEFYNTSDGTMVVRTLRLHPKGHLVRPLLWIISLLLKRAISTHLKQLSKPAPSCLKVIGK